MDITMQDGETLYVKSEKGRYGAVVVLECINGNVMNRTDHERLEGKE